MQLSSLGVTAENISFATTTMESDKYICVREGKEVIIVDVVSDTTLKCRWFILSPHSDLREWIIMPATVGRADTYTGILCS